MFERRASTPSRFAGERARSFCDLPHLLEIAAAVKSDIAARRKIVLERTAIVIGDLTTPGIVIEEGAKLKGRIVIGSDPDPAPKAAATEPAKQATMLKKAPSTAAKPAEAPASQPLATSA